jgi:hypothetical protein
VTILRQFGDNFETTTLIYRTKTAKKDILQTINAPEFRIAVPA